MATMYNFFDTDANNNPGYTLHEYCQVASLIQPSMSTFRRRTAKQRHRLVELSPETHVLLDEAMARHHSGNPDSALQAALKLWLEHGSKEKNDDRQLPN